jgi:hypothetical protein
VRQMVRGLNELNQNIRRYVERATREKEIAHRPGTHSRNSCHTARTHHTTHRTQARTRISRSTHHRNPSSRRGPASGRVQPSANGGRLGRASNRWDGS